ncbi:MAG: DegT/DnrJ/EryC1/StrS family aminotransferase, partial [bacterium]|nr:DegT/DnrJ/EryC1/StrS family aminotransferase [bacterium]
YVPGLNVRSTDLNAWIGLGQLEKLDWMVQRRQENHEHYRRLLGDRFYIQKYESYCQIASISFGLLADNVEQRRAIVSALVKKNIETRIFSAGNLGLHPFWYQRYGKASFPVADRIHYCGLFLPNHPTLLDSDVDFIARVVLDAAS